MSYTRPSPWSPPDSIAELLLTFRRLAEDAQRAAKSINLYDAPERTDAIADAFRPLLRQRFAELENAYERREQKRQGDLRAWIYGGDLPQLDPTGREQTP